MLSFTLEEIFCTSLTETKVVNPFLSILTPICYIIIVCRLFFEKIEKFVVKKNGIWNTFSSCLLQNKIKSSFFFRLNNKKHQAIIYIMLNK